MISVNIPISVKEIGQSAFKNNKLKNITIPSNVKNIRKNAFKENPYISKINFSGNYDNIKYEEIFDERVLLNYAKSFGKAYREEQSSMGESKKG